MTKISFLPMFAASCLALGGCVDGLTPYTQSPDTVIATANDTGIDSGALVDGEAAIAYDPDGCQAWIIDDGVEGYSGRRFDPVTGLPICNDLFAPGTVLVNHQTQSAGVGDWVPGSRAAK